MAQFVEYFRKFRLYLFDHITKKNGFLESNFI